jgi:hypothetical protein
MADCPGGVSLSSKEVSPKPAKVGVLMSQLAWESSYGRALRDAAEQLGLCILKTLST